MTLLLTLQAISKSYGSVNLFKELSFSLREKEKVGLVGPNGAGKSTLLKILAGCDEQDEGSIIKRQGLRIGYASQMPEFPAKTLEETLFEADTYHTDHFEKETEARILLGKAQFTDFDQLASKLSGGWKKRLDIARALMQDPDLLLLDEPTNHLDIEGILWLEKLLQKERRSILVVSHDRYFLENVCTKIVEINRSFPDGIFVVDGGMSTFMEKKVAMLESQKRYQQSLTSIVKDEVEWLRKSPKARTTKSRSRIQKAYELMRELSDVQSRNKTTKVSIEFSESSRETKKLLSAKNLAKSLNGKQLFKGIDITLSPGTRLGVVGKNGTGKTTLLKILSGEISPDMGTVKMAQDIRIVYFDQHREQINSNLSLRDALSPNGDYVDYRGQSIHVNGWAKKFLFSPARLSLPVRCLSGGERARISIAKLLLQPADILFLDEPTNDLDIETLEVIEESLQEFEGAVVLISHDRCLMDQICTSIIGLGEELEERFFADYSQWERAIENAKQPVRVLDKTSTQIITKEKKKLNYKEQKELDAMEAATIALEHNIAELQLQLEDPSVAADNQKLLDCYQVLGKKQQELADLFDRWQELINKSES